MLASGSDAGLLDRSFRFVLIKAKYLGPIIVADKDRPVRVKFTNNLPATANGGNLFIPTDLSMMGASVGPDGTNSSPQNRGTLHLHGGMNTWISDGTPHQWVAPAADPGPDPRGVSTRDVPDMPPAGGGSMTAKGSGYTAPPVVTITDATGTGAVAYAFVNSVLATDPTWDTTAWSKSGGLWLPHVYMPNETGSAMGLGANAMGRWEYAAWFWPPYIGLLNHGLIANPYYALVNAPWEPA